MKHFAVIGHPIGHSLSPLMHNTAFKLLGMDCEYEMLDIEPDSLKQAIERFKDQNWGGFNVTVPHKEAIIPLMDEVVPEAREVGAVNTVMNRSNKLIGYNTEVIGVERSLLLDREKIEGTMCTIMGSGGVARSVAHVLAHKIKPKTITFSALFPEQAHALIKSIGGYISNSMFSIVMTRRSNMQSRTPHLLLMQPQWECTLMSLTLHFPIVIGYQINILSSTLFIVH
jgi:shikimate dehydrogenase